MPLFVIGFCYSIPLACGSADALSDMQWLSVADTGTKDRSGAERLSSVTRVDEGCWMETSKRDMLLGTLTWWGFHALLMWMGVSHFLSRDFADGGLFASDLFAGVTHRSHGAISSSAVGGPPPTSSHCRIIGILLIACIKCGRESPNGAA